MEILKNEAATKQELILAQADFNMFNSELIR
jgi:hypothetical protein